RPARRAHRLRDRAPETARAMPPRTYHRRAARPPRRAALPLELRVLPGVLQAPKRATTETRTLAPVVDGSAGSAPRPGRSPGVQGRRGEMARTENGRSEGEPAETRSDRAVQLARVPARARSKTASSTRTRCPAHPGASSR